MVVIQGEGVDVFLWLKEKKKIAACLPLHLNYVSEGLFRPLRPLTFVRFVFAAILGRLLRMVQAHGTNIPSNSPSYSASFTSSFYPIPFLWALVGCLFPFPTAIPLRGPPVALLSDVIRVWSAGERKRSSPAFFGCQPRGSQKHTHFEPNHTISMERLKGEGVQEWLKQHFTSPWHGHQTVASELSSEIISNIQERCSQLDASVRLGVLFSLISLKKAQQVQLRDKCQAVRL